MFKLIVKCRKANVTHMLLPSVFVAVHEEKRKEAAQHKHKERERLEYNRRAVFENRRESLHIWAIVQDRGNIAEWVFSCP